MRTSETLSELATALAIAQGEMEVAKKENTNTFFTKGQSKSKYADINNIWVACRAALSKNGIAVIQAPSVTPERYLKLTTKLLHKSGEWIESDLELKPKEDTPQSIISCSTYARRCSLQAMVGVVAEDEDDDGNIATFGSPKPKLEDKPKDDDKPKDPPKANGIFNKNNTDEVLKMHNFLKEKGLSAASFTPICDELDGKNVNIELPRIFKKLKEKEV